LCLTVAALACLVVKCSLLIFTFLESSAIPEKIFKMERKGMVLISEKLKNRKLFLIEVL
jgi:hypothetical protein